MLRVIGLCLGVCLAWLGGSLAWQEGNLVEARRVARDGLPGRLTAQDYDLEEAYRRFALVSSRTDLLELETELALELDRRSYPKAFLGSGLREERIYASFVRLARAAPGVADAWCMLALAEARRLAEASDLVNERLRACYALASREVKLFETRLHLSLAIWDRLPMDLRRRALTDAARGLQDRHFGGWMLEKLAYGVAVIAPDKEAVLLPLIEPYGSEAVQRFKTRIIAYRKQFAPQGGALFPG